MLEDPVLGRTPVRVVSRRSMFIAVSIVGGLLIGCGDGPSDASGDVADWSVTPLTVIQPGGAPGALPFGRIADLEIGRDSSVIVLDGLNGTVRVFDQRGNEVRAFGGRGQGPGEFTRPADLLWGLDGNLWVLDNGNGRLTEFDPEGRLLSTHRPTDLPIVFPFAVTFSGVDTLRWAGITSPDPANPAAAWVQTELADGEVRPTARTDLPFVEWPLLFEHRSDDIAFVLPVPFSGEPLFAFDPTGRLWYAHTGEPRLHRWSTSGEIDLTLGRDLDPRAITAVERDEALAAPDLEELRVRLGQAGVTEISAMMPDTKPYLSGFFFDDEGHVWVMRALENRSNGDERILDIYDLDGTPIARAHVAIAADPRPRVRGGLLTAVVRDTLDVESVVLFQVGK